MERILTEIQKCFLKLLNNHTDVVILRHDFDLLCMVERNCFFFFCFKSHHNITISRQWDLQRYFLPLAANYRWQHLARKSVSMNRHVATTFPCIYSAFFFNSCHHSHTTYNHITGFCPVTWLCRLKCWIFLGRQLSPVSDTLWIIAFSTERFTVSKPSARPTESSPLSGVGVVSGRGPE